MTSRAEIHKPFFTLVTGLAACHNQSQIHETGAGEKEIGLFKRQPPDKVGDSCLKAHLNISVQAEVFIRREREAEQRDQGVGVEHFSVCRPAQSVPIRTSKLVKRWFGVCHPGFMVEGQQISQSWDA